MIKVNGYLIMINVERILPQQCSVINTNFIEVTHLSGMSYRAMVSSCVVFLWRKMEDTTLKGVELLIVS
jgi:hypothetical protein